MFIAYACITLIMLINLKNCYVTKVFTSLGFDKTTMTRLINLTTAVVFFEDYMPVFFYLLC